MTAPNIRVGLQMQVTFTLSETEVRALDALIGYGIDPFLKVFYEKLGKHYMSPHEAGLRELFDQIGKQIRPALHEVEWHRRALQQGLAYLAENKS